MISVELATKMTYRDTAKEGKFIAKDFPSPCTVNQRVIYIEASRLEKAREIKDIEIIELGADKIVADVRGYSIYIDIEKRFILHDCGDWKRTMRERRFCKHIGALMLALPEEAARGVLEGIKRQEWEFSEYTGRGEA